MNSYSFFVEGGRGGGQLIKKIQPPDEGLIRERGGGLIKAFMVCII